jgi:hypothetical protein
LIASVFLSAAIAIKLTPLILIMYLLLRRDFLWATVALAMSLILAVGLPYAISGPVTFQWYAPYLRLLLTENFMSSGQVSQGFAFSITSIISFLLPSAPKVLSFALSGAISLIPIALTQLPQRKDESGSSQSLVFALYMLAILLVSPVSETHHLANTLPALSLTTAATLLYSPRHWYAGITALTIALLSLIAGQFYFPATIVCIVALYMCILWICRQPVGRTTLFITRLA